MDDPGKPGVGEQLDGLSFSVLKNQTNIYREGDEGILKAKSAIDADLADFSANWMTEFNIVEQKPIEAFCEILLRGGKRLRGILAMQSYYAHGGTNVDVAIGAARVSEIGQTYLLLIDDIQDKSETRRGGLSAHRLLGYQAVSSAMMHGDLDHYGEAQAINAALAGMHRADTELLNLPAEDSAVLAALRQMHLRAETTAAGQMKDIYNQASNMTPSAEDIEDVLTKKTAYYTFVGPLELGATLAGHSEIDADLLEYAVNIGCAYQIADDLIGTFGAQEQTGKSNNDDIREGKMTLLSQHALTRSNERQLKVLQRVLGNNQSDDTACDEVRSVMIQTSARHYCEERLAYYRVAAGAALEQAKARYDPQFIAFLDQVISYASKRSA